MVCQTRPGSGLGSSLLQLLFLHRIFFFLIERRKRHKIPHLCEAQGCCGPSAFSSPQGRLGRPAEGPGRWITHAMGPPGTCTRVLWVRSHAQGTGGGLEVSQHSPVCNPRVALPRSHLQTGEREGAAPGPLSQSAEASPRLAFLGTD